MVLQSWAMARYLLSQSKEYFSVVYHLHSSQSDPDIFKWLGLLAPVASDPLLCDSEALAAFSPVVGLKRDWIDTTLYDYLLSITRSNFELLVIDHVLSLNGMYAGVCKILSRMNTREQYQHDLLVQDVENSTARRLLAYAFHNQDLGEDCDIAPLQMLESIYTLAL